MLKSLRQILKFGRNRSAIVRLKEHCFHHWRKANHSKGNIHKQLFRNEKWRDGRVRTHVNGSVKKNQLLVVEGCKYFMHLTISIFLSDFAVWWAAERHHLRGDVHRRIGNQIPGRKCMKCLLPALKSARYGTAGRLRENNTRLLDKKVLFCSVCDSNLADINSHQQPWCNP